MIKNIQFMLIILLLVLCSQTFSQNRERIPYKFYDRVSESAQFDFWVGEWSVNNRWLTDNGSWRNEGSGYLKVWPVLDGKAVMELWNGKGNKDNILKGFSIRYFDKPKNTWIACLNWPQKNNGGFFMLDGNFRFNRCEIFNKVPAGNDQIILNRYTFSDITDTTYRWNNGSSNDTGKTWKTTWIMENRRINDEPVWPGANGQFPTYDNDNWTDSKESKLFHLLEGSWKGIKADSSETGWQSDPVQFEAWKVQNGISMLYRLTAVNGFEELGMITWRSQNNIWMLMRLDNLDQTGIITQYAKAPANQQINFVEYSQLYTKPTTENTSISLDEKNFSITRKITVDSTGSQIASQTFTLGRINK